MKRLVDHKLRLGLDDATYNYVEEIYQDKKLFVQKISRNDILVELIQNGILVYEGKIKFDFNKNDKK